MNNQPIKEKIVKEIKEMETYKLILKESLGGIMYNVANKNKYNNDIVLRFKELEKINNDIWNSTDGIFRGVHDFIMNKEVY